MSSLHPRLLTPAGELDMDIWGLHLETSSPELQHEKDGECKDRPQPRLTWMFEFEAVCCQERTPSWVNFYGWTSELQVLVQPWTVVAGTGVIG